MYIKQAIITVFADVVNLSYLLEMNQTLSSQCHATTIRCWSYLIVSLLTEAGLDPTSVELDDPSSLDVELGRDDDLRDEMLPPRLTEAGLFDVGDESISIS